MNPTPLLLLALCLTAQRSRSREELTSGRPVPPGESCYDVQAYDLAVRVDPARHEIEGCLRMTARLLQPSEELVLDLDSRLEVSGVWLSAATDSGQDDEGERVRFQHEGGEIRVRVPANTLEPAPSLFELTVRYAGKPREAPRPPWDGGFIWSKTRSGAPWIATANQMQGADLWWPCKDQPDDEAQRVLLRVTVPAGLTVATNGAFDSVREDYDAVKAQASKGWNTHQWHVSTPINTYGIALNIAPYETITREYTSVAGDTFPVTYWVLPENVEQGKLLFEDILQQMRGLEELFGPYPFRGDKYGVAETPHLGMEHQSIIAYGNQYHGNPWGEQYGFDMLHLHEFAHEWWANLVTCRNWNDFWIHEGFASYAQALYCEKRLGPEAYFREMQALARGITNRAAVAPREPRSTAEMYFGDREGSPGGDIYNKGAWIVHSLRWCLGDELFFQALRRMAYPDPALEQDRSGQACRFATTDELCAIVERVSDRDLGWFFEVYLRQPALPELRWKARGGKLTLEWHAPGSGKEAGPVFPMPVEVRVGEQLVRVECPGGKGELEVGRDFEVDPRGWILCKKGER